MVQRHLDFTKQVPLPINREERTKLYNQKYRDTHSGTITCECGSEFKEIGKYTHAKTKRHTRYLESLKTKE